MYKRQQEKSAEAAERLTSGKFTLEDFATQIKEVRKMFGVKLKKENLRSMKKYRSKKEETRA